MNEHAEGRMVHVVRFVAAHPPVLGKHGDIAVCKPVAQLGVKVDVAAQGHAHPALEREPLGRVVGSHLHQYRRALVAGR